jgi:hypothetical protein
MAEQPQTHVSWWQTVPGTLTGIAAIITAVTGLVIAFNHGSREAGEQGTPPTQSSTPVTGSPEAASAGSSGSNAAGSTPSQAPGGEAAKVVALPSPNPLRLAGGDAVITMLSAQVESIDADRRLLKLHLRYLNAGRYPAGFGSASYRLLVDDVPRAPTNLLNEVVDGESAKEGDVIFEVPAAVKDVVLQVSAGDEKSRVPLKLP